ncbi:CBS domain-containing protein [Arhodomonas aquaeolei]|uniref:CBS domain-containing protein n=1 Tax=Arhodomonas aquaeolei TaxID=2369 RepID=UPI00039A7732|nr:CBS domain-containing protein [Arhodomonas aquaeolei]
MSLTAADVMTRRMFTLTGDDSVELARELCRNHRVRHIPIVDGRYRLVGLVSDGDVLRSLSPFTHTAAERDRDRFTLRRPIHQIMTRVPETIIADVDLRECARRMSGRGVGSLPVVDGETLVGIVTWQDVLAAVADGRI